MHSLAVASLKHSPPGTQHEPVGSGGAQLVSAHVEPSVPALPPDEEHESTASSEQLPSGRQQATVAGTSASHGAEAHVFRWLNVPWRRAQPINEVSMHLPCKQQLP